ncbi:MAG: outer membrane protein [Lentisphaeria bacterium]|jgi:outer membrane protein
MLKIRAVFLCFVALIFSPQVFARQQPKLELGLALAGQVLNDYRGSESIQTQAYPIPFFLYRGKFLKADRSGVRAEILSSNNLEFNLSGETALNGSSNDNELRFGMPDLESAFELGPSLNINVTGDNFGRGWQLRFPLRGVVTLGDTGVHYIGYNFNPRFTYVKPNVIPGWTGKANVGLLYGSQRYHDYYYSVAEQYVTEGRERYTASRGFSGTYFKASLGRRNGPYIYAFSLRYDNLEGATFESSPLVETANYFSFSFIFARFLWHS